MTLLGKIRTRLGLQLLVAITFVSLAPLAGTGILLWTQTESSLRNEVVSHQEQAAEISANLTREYMANAREKLEIIALFLSKQSYQNPKQLTGALEPRLESAGIFLDLNYYQLQSSPPNDAPPENIYSNSQQEQFESVQQMAPGGNFLDPRINPDVFLKPFFREASQGAPFIATQLETVGEIPFLTLSVPVLRKERPVAVLAANLDFRPVNKLLSNVAGEGRFIELLDEAGVLAASGKISQTDLIETVQPVKHGAWKIRVAESKSRALEPLRKARLTSILLLTAAGFLALGLSWFLSRRILRPVRILTSTAQQVEMGNLQARTGIRREDEIGDLARSFDHMTESLQQLDQLKSDFVSHVSHELRTPLTSGKLSLANLEDEVLGPMTEKQKEVAGRIQKDIDRLIRMVNELLDIARLEAGKVEIHRQKIDLAEVITKTLETLQPLAAPRNIKISFASTPFPLEGDPSRLEQIFLNLIDNAIKHSPEGGEISIRMENRTLFIEDQGPGLPDEGKHLFEKFAPRKTGTQGVGLGLSITKKLVELHGGTILGETRTEGGSRFTVRFP